MISGKLKQFGLTDKETSLYLALLELGQASVQSLAKKAKLKRASVYTVLDSLKEKGLAGSTMKRKRRYYTASDPRELEFKMDERKRAVKSVIPELMSIANLIDKKPTIRFYEGEEGLKEIYLDTLKQPNRPMWAWVTEDIYGTLSNEFLDEYLATRVKNKIWAYVIIPDTAGLKKYKADDKLFIRKTLVEPTPLFKTSVEIILYESNKIGIIAFKEKTGLIIESQQIFDTLKSIFDVHWQRLGGEI